MWRIRRSGFWPFFYHLLGDPGWTSLLTSLSLDFSICDTGSALPALLSSSWRTVVGICGTEDPGALQKSPRISTTVVFYYLLGTNPPVWADTGARQWYVLQPWRSILGNNQYKMHWVWATIRVINVDSLLLDKINNAWEKHCKNLREGKQSVSGERV